MVLGRMVSKIDRRLSGKVAWYGEHVSACNLKSAMAEGSNLMDGLIATNG